MASMVVTNIRILEDGFAAILLLIAIVYLAYAAKKLKGSPVSYMPLTLCLSLIPLWGWKTLGAVRRIAVDKASNPELYIVLHDTGEILESLSGLAIAVALLFIYTRIKKSG